MTTGNFIDDDDWDGEEFWDEYEWEDGYSEPDVCGPWCGDCWGGDGICMLEIERQVQEDEDYRAQYVSENVACPVCGAIMTQYRIPANQLWVWPGQWPGDTYYSPTIALDIFAAYDAPKGVVHQTVDGHCHIWVGEGEYRTEKLVTLLGTQINTPPNNSLQPTSPRAGAQSNLLPV